ncbi:hypothetical protein CRG98_006674 [Punica granatum]|uniref:Uncharacterized protein n=1 Tax=Punica granatum TaxID=22663 RepID=A0A2I0KWX4_PUNGR|nr:hypothetical protein CRG98_006674 [Punica granatum]
MTRNGDFVPLEPVYQNRMLTTKVPRTPLVEALNIDHAETLEECQNFTNLMWPAGNDRSCKADHSYTEFIERLEAMVMRMVFDSYGQKCYKSYADAATLLLRFLKYKKPHDAWSNGRIKACYHRVAVREENEVRYSLGVFSYQKGMIKTPDELIDEERPQQFKPFDHVDFLCYRDSSDNRVKAQSLIKTYWGV